MVDQTKTQGQDLDVVEISLESGSYTHIFYHQVLYSLKRNKFVSGRAHKGASWGVDYRILPGYYIMWYAHGYKDIRGFTISLEKVKVYKDENGKGVKETVETICEINGLTRDDVVKMVQDQRAPESLKDFIECLPFGYHSVGCVPDPTKTFSPDEVTRVCQYLRMWRVETAED